MSEHQLDDKSRKALIALAGGSVGALGSFYFASDDKGDTAGLVVARAGDIEAGRAEAAGARGGKLRKSLKVKRFCRGVVVRTNKTDLSPAGLYFERRGGNLSARDASRIVGRVFYKSCPTNVRKALKKVTIHTRGGLDDAERREKLGLPQSEDEDAPDGALAALSAAEQLDEQSIAAEKAAILTEAQAELDAARADREAAQAAVTAALKSLNPMKVARALRDLSKKKAALARAQEALASARSSGDDLGRDLEGLASLASLSRELTAPPTKEISLSSITDDILASDKPVPEKKSTLKSVGQSIVAALDISAHLYQAMLDADGRKARVIENAQGIPNQDILYEQLAHGIYADREGFQESAQSWGYGILGHIGDASTGFYARLYGPTGDVDLAELGRQHGRDVVPVMVMLGTNDIMDVMEDMNEHGVGYFQVARNIGAIKTLMDKVEGKIDITGHSLGGALAQQVACRFPDRIRRITTFQSPGIDAFATARIAVHNEDPELEPIESSHYVAPGDVVHRVGQEKTPGKVYQINKIGLPSVMDHKDRLISDLAEIRILGFEGVEQNKGAKTQDRILDIEVGSTEDGSQIQKLFESVRQAVGHMISTSRELNRLSTEWRRLLAHAEASQRLGTLDLPQIEQRVDELDIPPELQAQFKANLRVLLESNQSS